MPEKTWDYHPFRGWLLDSLSDRDWRPMDLARRMKPDSPQGAASSISKYLRGVRQPDPATCLAMASIFGDDPDRVLQLAGHRAQPFVSSATRQALHNLIEELPEEALQSLLLMLRAMQDRQTRIPPTPS